ncbi:MAG: DUF4279 domain-containing protein [Chloroflexota bacterium]
MCLNPSHITKLLSCEPTRAAKKGDNIANQDGKGRISRTGLWHISYGDIDAVPLEKKIDGLLSKLADDLQTWREITNQYKADIFCGLFLDNLNEGFELSPALMKRISDRNLKIGFDIYASTDSWESKSDGNGP